MKKYTNNKDFNNTIKSLRRNGWICRKAKKHNAIVSPYGKKVFFSKTPSDHRALHNFKRDIAHVVGSEL